MTEEVAPPGPVSVNDAVTGATCRMMLEQERPGSPTGSPPEHFFLRMLKFLLHKITFRGAGFTVKPFLLLKMLVLQERLHRINYFAANNLF